MTSFGVVLSMFSENITTDSRRPSTMAFLWRATPTPDKYLASESASCCTRRRTIARTGGQTELSSKCVKHNRCRALNVPRP